MLTTYFFVTLQNMIGKNPKRKSKKKLFEDTYVFVKKNFSIKRKNFNFNYYRIYKIKI